MPSLLLFLAWVLIVLGVLGLILAVFAPGDGRYRIPGGFVGPLVLIIVGIGLLLVPIA